MKKKSLVLLCVAMLMAGCADQGADKEEVCSIDLGGITREEETGEKQAGQAAGASQPDEGPEQESAEVESASEENSDSIRNDTSAQHDQNHLDSGAAQGNESVQELYTKFLNNEVPAFVGNEYLQYDNIENMESGKPYTFAELGQYVNQSYFDPEYSEKTSYDQAQYAYVECPDSNSRNLLVRFVGLDIYSQGDDSFAVYVITGKDGQLYLTDEYACWARSYTEQYRNGLCSTFGSNGAGSHYSGMSAILSNGIETPLYEAEILSGWWTSYVDGTIYNEVLGETPEAMLNVSVYTIGEDKYYTYDLSECTDDQISLCETYISRCRDEAGINWVTDAQVQEAVQERCGSLGVDYGMLEQQEETEWVNIG